MSKAQYVFVGFAVPDSIITDLSATDALPQVAAHKLQWNIINGMEHATNGSIDILSAIPASNYPQNKQILFRYNKWNHKDASCDILLPYINLIILKHVTRFISSMLFLFLWYFKKLKCKRYVVVYAMHSPFVLASVVFSKLTGSHLFLIVPDLPEFMDVVIKRSLVRRTLKYIDIKLQRMLMRNIDGLIVLTKQIGESINQGVVPYIVMEGIISTNMDLSLPNRRCNFDHIFETNIKTLLYAGGVAECYGMKLLLDAFHMIPNQNYRLIICGKGEMESDVLLASKRDPRIIYLGQLPNADILQLEKMVTLLINVRPTHNQFTQFSFPSKILEYMLSGRPVLTTKLPGIPEEYYNFIFLLENESESGLAVMIQNICSKPDTELLKFGLTARNYVSKNKNFVVQGKRIVNFISAFGLLL